MARVAAKSVRIAVSFLCFSVTEGQGGFKPENRGRQGEDLPLGPACRAAFQGAATVLNGAVRRQESYPGEDRRCPRRIGKGAGAAPLGGIPTRFWKIGNFPPALITGNARNFTQW
ncbi:hypothetical protein GCM10008024_08900 [Allgaiera indica]|uniref:Uncharacterized protein n=1 Tax=Allgaiera indica TaxID=765699 RepID=A0AAN4UQ99_9RHOB|nr:hypothetical protein GCM10008024_08900 [Allgaiera indica]